MTEVTGSEATRRKLEDAAVAIIERDGILAGLNLQEVADLAGVNRGNIYHYFGSRQELLRSALAARISAGMDFLNEGREQRLADRKLRVFLGLPDVSSALLALLAIDGDDNVDPMPDFENSMSDLARDVEAGDIDSAYDLLALQVAFQSVNRGYELLRHRFADRAGVSVDELDERVTTMLRHWLLAMRGPPAAEPPSDTA